MPERIETESRKLLGRLRKALATSGEGQDRLNKVVVDAHRSLFNLSVP